MRKIVAGLCLIAVVLSASLFVGQIVSAARQIGQQPVCNTDDSTYFPYGMFCGSDGANYAPIQLTSPYKNESNKTGTDRIGNTYTIPYGTSNVAVKMKIDSRGRAKNSAADTNNRDVLPFITIDTSVEDLITGISSDRGGSPTECPGANLRSSAHPNAVGRVYGQSNYGGNSAQPTNKDESPYGFEGSQAAIDCGKGGKMVHWKNQTLAPPSYSGTYNINISLRNVGNVSFCVRGDLSVYYPGYSSLFPPGNTRSVGDLSPDELAREAQNDTSVASHLARQSERTCFKIEPAPSDPPPRSVVREPSCKKLIVYNDKNVDQNPSKGPPNGAWYDPPAGGWTARTYAEVKDSNGNILVSRTKIDDDDPRPFVKNYLPRGKDVTTTITREVHAKYHYKKKDYYAWGQYSTAGTGTAEGCYRIGDGSSLAGTCDILNVYGDTEGRIVQGRQIFITLLIKNSGAVDLQSPLNHGASPPLSTNINSAGWNDAGVEVPSGTTKRVTLSITAPSGPRNQGITVYVGYPGVGDLNVLASCSSNAAIYAPYTVSANSNTEMTPGEENPTNVSANTSIQLNSPAAVRIGQSSEFVKNTNPIEATGYTANVYSPNSTTTVLNRPTYNPNPAKAGDRYCTKINLDRTYGYIGPNGPDDQFGVGGALPGSPSCTTIHNEPYVHFFGAPVSAGGCFGAVACANSGTINTYTNPGGGADQRASGSGAQFGAEATGFINGLKTASLRTAPNNPSGPNGTTISNAGFSANTKGGQYGGNSGIARSVPDYFGFADGKTFEKTSGRSIGGGSGVYYYEPLSGAVTLGNGLLSPGDKQTIYVKGDVYITSDIRFASSANYGDINSIPSFMLVASGNIYIDKAVSQLDGIYVAQPNASSNSGLINTCGNGASSYDKNQIYNNCNAQLVVNGSFIGKKILLDRSYSSLRAASQGEYIGSTNKPCVDGNGPNKNDCAAEIFNFSPETILSQPTDVLPSNGSNTLNFDYLTSLAPVL